MARHEKADVPTPTRNLVSKNNQNNYLFIYLFELVSSNNVINIKNESNFLIF